MLADQLDYIVGVDPHRDSHALAVLHVISGAVVFEAAVSANSEGYAQALELVDQHAAGRRAFAVEGTGSFGAGLTRFLTGQGERVLEVSRLRRERRSGGKRPTRSTLSVPPAACSPRNGRRHRGREVNARHCRPWSLHAKEQSTPKGPGSASCATC
jgi:hypothetical protein